MGFGGSGPTTQQVDTTNPYVKGTAGAAGDFFSNIFSSGQNPFAGVGTGGLAGQAGNAIGSMLGQNPLLQAQGQVNQSAGGGGLMGPNAPAANGGIVDPSQGILGQAQGSLGGAAAGQTIGQNGLGVGADALGLPGNVNLFGQGAGQSLIGALNPLRQQQAQGLNTQLANSAAGVYSTALGKQGADLNAQLQNQFAAQDADILRQGQMLDTQIAQGNQQAAIQGAGQLNQFYNNNANAQLGQAGLNLQGQLGSLGLLGQLGQNVFGNSAGLQNQMFNQALGAGQFGLQQNQAAVAPYLQLLGLGTQFAGQGMGPQDTVVQPGQPGFGSFLGTLGGSLLGGLAGPVGASLGGALGKKLFSGGGGNPNTPVSIAPNWKYPG